MLNVREKGKNYILNFFCPIFVTIFVYSIMIVLSSGERIWDIKNICLTFVFTYFWSFVYMKADQKVYIIVLWWLCLFCGLTIPFFADYTGNAMFLSRLAKDVLYANALYLMLCFFCVMCGRCLISKIFVVVSLFGYHLCLVLFSSYSVTFNSVFSAGTFVSVLNTNVAEAFEFVQEYISGATVFFVVVSMFFLTVAHYFLYSQLYWKKVSGKFSWGVLVFFLICVLGVLMLGYKTYVLRVVMKGIGTSRQLVMYHQCCDKRKNSIANNCCLGGRHQHKGNYALVIGESHNRSHMSYYGYARETTPFLDRGMRDNVIVDMPNSYSCAALTHEVLDQALSETSQYTVISDDRRSNIVEMAQHAGYRVVWISNQSRDSFAGIIADSADRIFWLNKASDDTYLRQNNGVLDSNIVSKLQNIEDDGQPTLYIIHLLGSHSRYCCRYPAEFNRWSNIEIGDIYQNSTNGYDNTILYNDYIMEDIRNILMQKLSVSALLYFSDHGEDADVNFRHGDDFFLSNYTKHESVRDIVQIPVYLAFSKRFAIENRDKLMSWNANRIKYFTNDMIYDTVLGLLDIKCQHYNEEQDLFSSKYGGEINSLLLMNGRIRLEDFVGYSRGECR